MGVERGGDGGAAGEGDRGEGEADEHGPARDRRSGAGGDAEDGEGPGAGRCGQEAQVGTDHTVACSRRPSSFAGPMPETSSRSSTAVKGPFFSRFSTIRAALARPTHGSSSPPAA